jgi:ABC-type antimicrobial peptide transport system ATPase subunit
LKKNRGDRSIGESVAREETAAAWRAKPKNRHIEDATMPLIVICGQPASGKSRVAAQLVRMLEPHGPVVLVDEPSLHLDRNASYSSE